MLCKGLTPLIKPDARVLILGSMPSQMSIASNQYYGNPRNHFWRLIYTVLGLNLPNNYAQRIQGLLVHKIALWDVLALCMREGSLDSAIKNETANDFNTLFDKYTDIRLVCFNGSKASHMWKKHIHLKPSEVDFLTLPSSSPMVGKNVKSFEEKISSWIQLKEYL